MKKTVSLILSIAMLFSITVFVATPASAAVIDTIEYNSRANYPTAADTNTYNWDDQWSAQVWDPALNDGAGGFEPMILNPIAKQRFTAKSALTDGGMNTSMGAMVYEIGMWPTRYDPNNSTYNGYDMPAEEAKALEVAKAERIYAAQVFTAPSDGYYAVKGATVVNTMTAPINVRIRKNGQAIEGALDAVYNTNFTYKTFGLELKAGDMLSFEAGYKAVDGVITFSTAGVVNWAPVVGFYGKNAYKSTHKYPSAVTADGTWEAGVWAAKIFDPVESKFYPLNATGSAANRFTVTDDIAEAGTSKTAYNMYHAAMVISGTDMWPTRTTDTKITKTAEVVKRSSVAIVFTAPKSGLVKIHGGSISNSLSSNGVVVSIRKNTSADTLLSKKIGVGGSTTYDSISLELQTGDTISFEAGIDGELVNNSGGLVNWKTPHISYVDMRNTFRANEAFSTTTADGSWDGVWSAKVYNPAFSGYADGFIDLTAITHDGARYALAKDTPSGNIFEPAYGSAPTVGTGIGGNLMMPSRLTTSSSTTQEVKEAYVAQVFTAPRSGWVTISGTEGNKLNLTAATDETIKMVTRIRKISGTESAVLSEATLSAGDTYLDDIGALYINEGDRISFEAKYDKVSEVTGSISGSLSYGDRLLNMLRRELMEQSLKRVEKQLLILKTLHRALWR